MISKDIFCSIIENMRIQIYKDNKNGAILQEAFGLNDAIIFDNDKLLTSIINLLRIHFPIDENGFCMISHYCFELDFGKESLEMEYISPEELYDALTSKK